MKLYIATPINVLDRFKTYNVIPLAGESRR